MTATDEAGCTQSALLAALEAGQVSGIGRIAQRIDTHLSHVFLTGAFAFKLYRAVQMPFVDLTRASDRASACRGEIEWNGGRARRLYLRAAPIVRSNNGFALGEGGEPETDIVDWIVQMHQFISHDQFDRMAAAGALTIEDIEDAAAMVAQTHASAPRREGGDLASTLSTLRQTCAQGAQRSGSAVSWQSRMDQLESEYARFAPLLEARRGAAKVRRVHGDLHLRNLCVFQDEVTAFDAITFDEALASCDVLYDLAFLLMDLRHVDLPRHANAALNLYWDASGEDEAALGLMPFFMSLRACVRMAVALEAGRESEAEAYARLSGDLLTPTPSWPVVALGGLSGTGKSALAKELAPSLPGPAGARILRSDILRKRLMGILASARADAQAYAPAERARVYRELIAAGLAAHGSGASVILDATFQTPAARSIAASAFGSRLRGYWLHAPLATRLSRISQRVHDASDADVGVAAAQREADDLEADWRRLDATRSLRDNRVAICRELGLDHDGLIERAPGDSVSG